MKKLVVVLVIAVLALGSGAAYLWKELGQARSQNADLQARMKTMETAQQASAAAFARQLESIRSNAAPAAAPAESGAAPKAAVASATTALAEDFLKQMTSPEGRDVRRAQRRMLLSQQYPDIGKWLDLSRDQESQLLDLIAKQQADQSDAVLDPANRNNPAGQQETLRKLQEQRQANDAELAALLGNKYPQYQEYQQTSGVHRQVSQLQAMLGSSVDGLSDAQDKSLTTALVAEQLRINQERSNAPAVTPGGSAQNFMQEQQQRTVESNRRLLEVASSQLNAQQLDGYRKLVDQQERTGNLILRTLGGQAAAQGQAGAAAPAGQ